jgi:DNA-binding FrmR family transcriptional regulator
MQETDRKSIDRRLARIEGQVRGIRRLVEQDSYCCDVLQQISAVSSALNQVSAAVATQHIKHCIVGHGSKTAHITTEEMTRDEVLDELGEVMSRLMR